MNKIDRELRKLEKEAFLENLKNSKLAILLMLLIIPILFWGAFRGPDKTIKSEIIVGYVVGTHQIQSLVGSTESRLSVKLP